LTAVKTRTYTLRSFPAGWRSFFAASKVPAMIAINVSQLLKQPPGATRDFEFTELTPELVHELQLTEPIEGRTRLLRTARGILASSRYRTAVRQSCGRCLEPAVTQLEGSSEDEFLPRVDVVTGLVLQEQPESAELAIDERHVLDLTEVIRQDLLTRLPLQPLCEPDCPGLCTECGRQLRAGGCSCKSTVENASPFAGLAELLARESAGGSSQEKRS
jgi:uncharacterized protein